MSGEVSVNYNFDHSCYLVSKFIEVTVVKTEGFTGSFLKLHWWTARNMLDLFTDDLTTAGLFKKVECL